MHTRVDSTLNIRKVTKADIPALVAVEQGIYGATGFNNYYFRQMLDLYPDLLWVCDTGDDDLAGYALGAIGQQRQTGWVLSLAVSEAHRDKGLAKQLTQVLLESLDNCGCEEVLLTVSEENQAAVGLYKKLGFAEHAHETDYYGPGTNRLVMRRS